MPPVVEIVREELKRFDRLPHAFRDSRAGTTMRDAIQLARDFAVRVAGQLARMRFERTLDELREHLRYNTRLLDAALAGSRGAPDATLAPWRVSARDADRNVARADPDQVLWPFDGELWPDEHESRQTIRLRCR